MKGYISIREAAQSGDECPHCDAGRDGGKCSFFRREKQKDVIAVCFCEKLRVLPEKLLTQKRLE